MSHTEDRSTAGNPGIMVVGYVVLFMKNNAFWGVKQSSMVR
jgi:hypothetical protein